MRMREALTKFIHQLSCGAALYFSHCHMETPPVRMTYSFCESESVVAAGAGPQRRARNAKRRTRMRIAAGICRKSRRCQALFFGGSGERAWEEWEAREEWE